MSRIVIVDEHDRPIGLKEREKVGPEDIYRASGLWITNSRGEALIAQRAMTKRVHPGRWATAVAGTVDEGEDYDDNMIKETEEEIGLTLTIQDLTKGPLIFVKLHERRFFCQWYYYTTDLPISAFTLKEDEVAAIRWISTEKFLEEIQLHPERFLPDAYNISVEVIAAQKSLTAPSGSTTK